MFQRMSPGKNDARLLRRVDREGAVDQDRSLYHIVPCYTYPTLFYHIISYYIVVSYFILHIRILYIYIYTTHGSGPLTTDGTGTPDPNPRNLVDWCKLSKPIGYLHICIHYCNPVSVVFLCFYVASDWFLVQ